MADESNDKGLFTGEVHYVRAIDQHPDGKAWYFKGVLVFKDGLLVEKRTGAQIPLRPITDQGAEPSGGAALLMGM